MKPLMVLLLAAVGALHASDAGKRFDRSFHLQWRDLANALRGRQVSLVLPSGIKLKGEAVAVNSDELTLDITGTSDKRAYPKGRAVVPRPEVKRLVVSRKKHLWRGVGTAIGAGVGVAVTVPIVAYSEGQDIGVACALAVAVPAGLGYLLGWAADSNRLEIVIDPDPAPLKNEPF